MAGTEKPNEKKKPETPEEKAKRKQREADENPDLLVAFAGFSSSGVNSLLGLEEQEKLANQIADRAKQREADAKAQAAVDKANARRERDAKGEYDARNKEGDGLKSPEDVVKGAKDGIFGADGKATSPWEALAGLSNIRNSPSHSVNVPLVQDPFSYSYLLGSEKFAGIAMDSINPYLSADGKKAIESLKGAGFGQFGKDSKNNDAEYSKDTLGLFDLFYTAATNPGDILRPLDNFYDQIQTFGGMEAAAKALKPFLSKDGKKIVDVFTALDLGKDDPAGMAKFLRALLHDKRGKDWPVGAFKDLWGSVTSGPGAAAILQAVKPFLKGDWGKAVDGLTKAGFGTDKDYLGLFPALESLLTGKESTVKILTDLFGNLTTTKGLAALLQGLTPFLSRDGQIAAKALSELALNGWKAGLGELIGLLPKGAQLPAKAILALLKNDFSGILLGLGGLVLPKELQQTFQIFMQMGGFKGIFGLELPKPWDLVGMGKEGEVGVGDSDIQVGCQGGPLAARVMDEVTSLGGGVLTIPASQCVMIGKQPASREGDPAICKGVIDSVAKGEPTVLIGGKPAARQNDPMAAGGIIKTGWPSVMIGGAATVASSTAAATSGVGAAVSSAGTAGGAAAGGAGGAGGPGEPGKNSEEGMPGGGATGDGGKKGAGDYDLSADGADKLKYPPDEGEEDDESTEPGLIDPQHEQQLQKGLDSAAKATEKGTEGLNKYKLDPDAEAKASAATAARAEANSAQAKADAAKAKYADLKQKYPGDDPDLDSKIKGAKSDLADAYDSSNVATKKQDFEDAQRELQKYEAQKQARIDLENARTASLDADQNATRIGKNADTLEGASKDASKLSNTVKSGGDLASKVAKYTGPLGYIFAVNDAITADGKDGISTPERIGVNVVAEWTPDVVIGGAIVGTTILISAPVAVFVGVTGTVGWGAYELWSGGDGEKALRGGYTTAWKGTKNVVNDAYDYWTTGW